MNDTDIADLEIEKLLVGKWRFNTSWEKLSIEFKNDMTYEQTRIQTLFLSKPLEFITGNQFTGVWHVREGRLFLNVKTLPQSIFNFKVPLVVKISAADFVGKITSVFVSETYEIIKLSKSKCIIKELDKEETITGLKIQ
ncbi:MAG: hypothetical protein RIC07_13285 [Coleofasciculus sp. E1-EBD-02]